VCLRSGEQIKFQGCRRDLSFLVLRLIRRVIEYGLGVAEL
jgi:hypothetical protein